MAGRTDSLSGLRAPLPRVVVMLWSVGPDLTSDAKRDSAFQRIAKNFDWALDEGWSFEYWGLRRGRARATPDGRIRTRGLPRPFEGTPMPILYPLAWAAQLVLMLVRPRAGIMFAPTPLSGAAPALLGRLVGRRRRGPLIVRLVGRTSTKAGRAGASTLSGRFVGSVERFVMRSADLVLAVSDFTSKLARDVGVDADRILEMPHPPIWRDDPRAADLPPASDGLRVVCAGRLAPHKGVDVLVRAFAMVADDVPTIRLDIAGSGVARRELEELASNLGVGDRIRFLGRVPPDEMLGFFDGALIAVLASRAEEGLPMSLVEGGLVGCALIGTDLGGTREIVIPGRTGILVPPDRPAALAEALRALLADPEATRRLGAEARQVAGEHLRRRASAVGEFRVRVEELRRLG